MTRTWAFVDMGAGYSPAELARIAPALQAQLREDVAPRWAGYDVDCAQDVVLPVAMPWSRAWLLGYCEIRLHATAPADDQRDVAYHARSVSGPMIHIFRDLLERYSINLSLAVSHELIEATIDPLCNRTSTLPDGRVVAVEACDQLEGTAYNKLGVELANWNLPSNFAIGSDVPPYDIVGWQLWMFTTLAPDGWAQVLVDGKWMRIGAITAYRADLAARGLGRDATRSAA